MNMSKILPGRRTVNNDQDIVVFLIGARINKWWLLPLSLPILSRNQAMVRELRADPDSGCLAIQSFGFASIQYWRDLESLQAYASAKERKHKPTWVMFAKKLFKNAAAGVWHETYQIKAGCYESIYVNMPAFGQGLFKQTVPADGPRATMARRLSPALTPDSH
jgi:hypothetical protein